MSNKYLEKVAAKKDTSDSKGTVTAKAVASHMAGETVAGVGLIPINHHFNKKLTNSFDGKGSADLHTVRKFMKDNNLHKTTTFNRRDHVLHKNEIPRGAASGSGPGYYHKDVFGSKKNFVGGVRNGGKSINPDIIMHELGHAKDFATHGKLKGALSMIGRHPIGKAVAATATVGALSNDKTRDYAPAIAAVPGAAVLREEVAANVHAYKGIKAHKGAAVANKFLRGTAKHNLAAYASAAAVPAAGAYLAKKIMDKWSPRKKDGK